MKKILLLVVAFTFVGVFTSSAQVVDNGYENACRFQDEKGQVWNGSTSTATRSYSNSSTASANASVTAGVEHERKILSSSTKVKVEGTVSGGVSATGGSVQSRTQNECCEYGNSNNCSTRYKKGHSDLAKNADRQSW